MTCPDGVILEFVEESRELLSTVGEDVMNLETGRDDEVVFDFTQMKRQLLKLGIL